MRKKLLLLLSLCLAICLVEVVTLPAQSLPDEALLAFDRKVLSRISINNMWEHLQVLTEEIGARYTGTSEDRAGVEYIGSV